MPDFKNSQLTKFSCICNKFSEYDLFLLTRTNTKTRKMSNHAKSAIISRALAGKQGRFTPFSTPLSLKMRTIINGPP
jgi:hypothetical protein